MSRLSRDKKREQQGGTTPIDVRVPQTGECATVAGTTVTAPAGEELHQAVLTHLHHLARTSGHPVHATIHDARIGWVVPLEIATDGASRFTADPVRIPPRAEPVHDPAEAFEAPSGPVLLPTTHRVFPTPADTPDNEPHTPPSTPTEPPAQVSPSAPPGAAAGSSAQVSPSAPPAAPTGSSVQAAPSAPPAAAAGPSIQAVPPAPSARVAPTGSPAQSGPSTPSPDHISAPVRPAASTPPPASTSPQDSPPPPGTAVPPTGAFGPPPVMDARPAAAAQALPTTHSAYTPRPLPPTPLPPTPLPSTNLPTPPQPLPAPGTTPTPTPRPAPAPLLTPAQLLDDPEPKPAPVRGFDAVAEAVMGEGLVVEDTAVLGEGVERISEAVREGRTEVAAELAQEVIAEAAQALGAEHPDVLRVRELAAYIAYLAGEPMQAADISLDLAGIQHRAGDAESAYGNLQSAATAWKAVRDPSRGLALGGDLIALWTEMAAGEGPAADEPEKLESARSRMLRLAERARNANS
ncbi:hypothetical protein ACFXPN_26520 [Streptomyces griseorubiginosus]|uniref:hypothetical protein n=1 Tax=Streptomyces griseorubiginosus TaxID=67304 RepID=UPI0036B4E00F